MRLLYAAIPTILICGLFILSGMSFLPPQADEAMGSVRTEYHYDNLDNFKLYYDEDILLNDNPISKN